MNEEAAFLFCVIILPNSDDLFAMARWLHLGHNLISILQLHFSFSWPRTSCCYTFYPKLMLRKEINGMCNKHSTIVYFVLHKKLYSTGTQPRLSKEASKFSRSLLSKHVNLSPGKTLGYKSQCTPSSLFTLNHQLAECALY